MIFPEQCKLVGFAATRPCGDQVYFLSRYLVRDTGDGYELLGIIRIWRERHDAADRGIKGAGIRTGNLPLPGESADP